MRALLWMIHSCQGWKLQKPVNLHSRAVSKATERREPVSYTRWNETHLAKWFSALLKVMETRWKERKKIHSWEMERKHFGIIPPEERQNTTYGTFLELQISHRMTAEKVTEGWSQWAESKSRVHPIQPCALTPLIIPPRAAIVSVLWMSPLNPQISQSQMWPESSMRDEFLPEQTRDCPAPVNQNLKRLPLQDIYYFCNCIIAPCSHPSLIK